LINSDISIFIIVYITSNMRYLMSHITSHTHMHVTTCLTLSVNPPFYKLKEKLLGHDHHPTQLLLIFSNEMEIVTYF